MWTNKKTAFSLIELLVSMAIIGVLLGLVGFGIATAQQNARDSQRRQTLSDIAIAVEDFRLKYGVLPAGIALDGTDIVLGNNAGGAGILENYDIDLTTGPTAFASNRITTANSTGYCYGLVEDGVGYELAVLLESGQVEFQNPTPSPDCATTSGGGALAFEISDFRASIDEFTAE